MTEPKYGRTRARLRVIRTRGQLKQMFPMIPFPPDSPPENQPASGDPRWHVCCRRCRTEGCQPGCGRCENRTRETFGQPHPDDFPGGLPIPPECPLP